MRVKPTEKWPPFHNRELLLPFFARWTLLSSFFSCFSSTTIFILYNFIERLVYFFFDLHPISIDTRVTQTVRNKDSHPGFFHRSLSLHASRIISPLLIVSLGSSRFTSLGNLTDYYEIPLGQTNTTNPEFLQLRPPIAQSRLSQQNNACRTHFVCDHASPITKLIRISEETILLGHRYASGVSVNRKSIRVFAYSAPTFVLTGHEATSRAK